jgi:hypothetical protein
VPALSAGGLLAAAGLVDAGRAVPIALDPLPRRSSCGLTAPEIEIKTLDTASLVRLAAPALRRDCGMAVTPATVTVRLVDCRTVSPGRQ